jgi:tetratricopeptide (TPR) repeat protein
MSGRSVLTFGISAVLFASTGTLAQPLASDAGDTGIFPDYNSANASPWPTDPSTEISVPELGGSDSGPATVSLHDLQHKVPGKAVREFDRATDARVKRRFEEAIGHLKKAISIDPEFTVARNNLAAIYMWKAKPELAVEQLEEAIRFDPHATIPYSNLALSYLQLDQLADAERAGRQAVDLDRSGPRSEMVLGMILVLRNKFTDEAERLLDHAKLEFPQAYLLNARLLAARGESSEARAQLEAYMAKEHEDAKGRALAQQWMNNLREARATTTASR